MKTFMYRSLFFSLAFMAHLFVNVKTVHAESGYDLWIRYPEITNKILADQYIQHFDQVFLKETSETSSIISEEISNAFKSMLNLQVDISPEWKGQGLIIARTDQLPFDLNVNQELGAEGFQILHRIQNKTTSIVVTANTDIGLLYGAFHLLKSIQLNHEIEDFACIQKPQLTHRLLNHWDNLDRTVERGYAGFSIWDWHKLPDYIYQRYYDYARANASLGINGTVVNNVNANALILTTDYLEKLKALADVFRPYGIKVYLTARFSAPVEIGGLSTADPLNEDVRQWWMDKTKEIYSLIPDFGGFLVKANSEGQPGPQDYDRSHADGANMLARALAPYQGIVMWRAFVYSHEVPEDRVKQAYNEFKPVDGEFEDNVFLQVKNGPIDFQPREPFHPLFGAMEQTPLMMEFQITQEYLGCASHLVYLGPLYEEVLKSDTYAKGKGSEVAKVIDGTLHDLPISGMAGVSNIGTDMNWTGHLFGQANWFVFGRLAWDPDLSSAGIADEWLRLTFGNNEALINIVKPMMLSSYETAVNYRTPLGLYLLTVYGHHWGPGPWVRSGFHRADAEGIGFNRSSTGSNATAQYFPEVASTFDDMERCPEELLLWFHHVPWNYKMKSGRTLWNELCYRYYTGAEAVVEMQKEWEKVRNMIDEERFVHVQQLLKIQADEAVWWRNSLLLYFQQYSKMPIPGQYEQPDKTLEYYKSLKFHYVPGVKH